MPASVVFALLIIALAVVVPIIVVLSFRHIRELEVIKRTGSIDLREAAEMRRELAELRELVVRQTLDLDGRTATPPPIPVDRLRI